MELEYGPVLLKVLDVNRFERRAVYTPDGADLLYVRNTIGVTATYAPGGFPRMPSTTGQSNSAADMADGKDRSIKILDSAPRGLPDPRGRQTTSLLESVPALESDLPGAALLPDNMLHTGPQTDMELRNTLMTPRQRLIVWAYKANGQKMRWLESPRPGFETDATLGPTPISCDVVAEPGEPHSVAVYYQLSTDMLPCPVGSDRLVLSHRWQMMHTHDEHHYLTRVIVGQIVFNGAYVHTVGVNPDSVRNQFIHPVPVGYQRTVPSIAMSPDGLTIRYTITDTDPTIMFSPGESGATHIQIMERLTLLKPWANWRL